MMMLSRRLFTATIHFVVLSGTIVLVRGCDHPHHRHLHHSSEDAHNELHPDAADGSSSSTGHQHDGDNGHHHSHGHQLPPRQKHFPPRHPGDTEHAILRFAPGSEVYYPAVNVTTEGERGLVFSKPPALRRCGVPGPSKHEIANTAKVLDNWERRNPGARRHLQIMFGQELSLHDRIRLLQEEEGPSSSANVSTPTNSPTLSPITAAPTRAPTRRPTRAPSRPPVRASTTRTVTVWWHVMKAGNTPALGKWTKRQVQRSIRLANIYFAGSPIRFVLGGVTQTVNQRWFRCPDEEDYATEIEYRTTLRREGADTLNVYMCDLRGGQGLWGFAYFPSILKDWPEYDGVVISNPFTRGDDSTALDTHMTFVHEVGHWMGLYHTWNGQCSASSGGDTVRDTAAHTENTWTYPGYQNCFEGRTYNSCPDNIKGVDPGFDPLLNHMNYVNTPCQYSKGRFTADQMAIMVSKFETYRYNKPTCRSRGVPCLVNSHCCTGVCLTGTTKKCT